MRLELRDEVFKLSANLFDSKTIGVKARVVIMKFDENIRISNELC